jgi:hypothetical protein
MASDLHYREVPLPLNPSARGDIAWKDGVGYSGFRTPPDAWLSFSLDRPRFVYAIRLRCSYEDDMEGMAEPRIAWGKGDAAETRDGEGPGGENGESLRVSKVVLEIRDGIAFREGRAQTVTFWVNSEIDRFRIHPDTKPFAFKVSEIVLLVPPDDPLKRDPKP